MNFTTATRKLNYISKTVGVDALNLGFVVLSLETVESWSVDTKREGKEELKGIENVTCVGMKEKTTWLKDSCRSLLLLADYEDKRTKTLIQVVCYPDKISLPREKLNRNPQVYQFMAQKDAKVNIDLARARR